MPTIVLSQLIRWGHRVDVLEPQHMITCLSDLFNQHYDAYILKTVSNGPGLSILEAAEAAGIPTINHSRAIRCVRDKAVAMALAQARGIPTPKTYFVADPRLLDQIPDEQFPLVVKPTHGSSCRDIYYVSSPSELRHLTIELHDYGFWLAQHYEENKGFDIKLYIAGKEVFAVAKPSPLHPDIKVQKRFIPLTPELHSLALSVGKLFGLDIYGLDVVETARGLMVVDINDFPSFGNVPEAEKLVAACILETSQRIKRQLLRYKASLLLPEQLLRNCFEILVQEKEHIV
jgi:ribosomal protein S6--L-glutamate ligase